ncbi:MAG: hypothetical protein VX642_08115 [Bdellovibrionota bacterium]|nr:hypothetical protein [Bdellovibrionota bacterium]
MKKALYYFLLMLLVSGNALATSSKCKLSASDNYFFQKYSPENKLLVFNRSQRGFDKWINDLTLKSLSNVEEKWHKTKAWLSGRGHINLSYREFVSEDAIEFPKKKFRDIWFSFRGKSRNLKSELDEYFQLVLPTKLAKMAMQINELHENQSLLTTFLVKLRSEVIREMKNDGYSRPEIYIGSSLLNRYYERVVSRILEEKGFVTNKGMPFDLKLFDEKTFFKILEQRKVFVDWTGLYLQGAPNQLPHGARPHILMIAYLAIEIPHFSELIHYIGKTNDAAKVWRLLFDNFDYGSQLSWNGSIIRYFGPYLGVSNF